MEDGANTLISPLSVLSALSMTANGAAGSTLEQMENVFGLPVTELNEYFRRRRQSVHRKLCLDQRQQRAPCQPGLHRSRIRLLSSGLV